MFSSLFSTHPELFEWVILPLLIFLARATDVTLSTLRIVFIGQGRTALAPLIGFFEALIWLIVIGQIFSHLSNPLCTIAYAAGFAMGNALGLRLEERLALGMRVMRIILQQHATELVAELRGEDFGVTVADGEGAKGPVKILFTLVRRRDVPRVIAIVRRHNPNAFYSIEDVRQASAGVFPVRGALPRPFNWLPGQAWRKTK